MKNNSGAPCGSCWSGSKDSPVCLFCIPPRFQKYNGAIERELSVRNTKEWLAAQKMEAKLGSRAMLPINQKVSA